VTDALSCSPKY
jgi:Integrase zinc binding domain